MTDEEFSWLTQLQRLTWLKIDETPPFDCIRTLRQLTNLRHLMVNMHLIQEHSFAPLTKLQQLDLGVVHNSNLEQFDIQHLTCLESLALTLNPRDPTVILEALTRLTHLDISTGGLPIDSDSLDRVARLTRLQSLRLALRWLFEPFYFDRDDCCSLTALQHLTRLDLSHVITAETGLELAAQLPQLKRLRIDGEQLM